ncbi:MAG TPA: hypothetical protein VGQ79_04935, partial [Nitrospiraceae bacterium]|nr:hypothetical protein [Nitrospiraceae bacterium]
MAQLPSVSFKALSLLFLFTALFTGCQTAPSVSRPSTVWSTIPSTLRAPLSIERLAVLYPKAYDRELLEAYSRLEGAVFQLKQHRPALRIVDRFNLVAVLGEQRLQTAGLFSEDYAIRLGRLLGVDGILLYRIEGPTVRDRLFGRYDQETGVPNFVIISKIIMVETAEVVFHNVVTSRV